MLRGEENRFRPSRELVSERLGGTRGRRPRGTAPHSARKSVVPIDHAWNATLHGAIMPRQWDVLKILKTSAGALALLTTY